MRGITACALCEGMAAMYCESDEASLCWDCDGKVHGANFLVARHTRVLLCRSCQQNTPWKASGARLSPIVSVCEGCAAGGMDSSAVEEDRCEEDQDYADDDDDDVSDDTEEEDEEDEGENQVVPWSLTSPPPACSSSGESSSSTSSSSTERSGSSLSKRLRENEDFRSQQDFASTSPSMASLYSFKKSCRSVIETTQPQVSGEVSGKHMIMSGDHSAIAIVSSDSLRPPDLKQESYCVR